MFEGICECGNYAVASEGQQPRCLMCIRTDHGLTETPSDLFRRTPETERRERYKMPMGSPAAAWPGERVRVKEAQSDERVRLAPRVTSRDRLPDGFKVPSAAAKLARGAEAAGWDVLCTYSEGYALPVKLADPPYRIATVAVRFSRNLGDGRARGGYVVYHQRLDRTPAKWEAKSLMVFGSDHWPVITGLGVTEVGRYLVDGVDWRGDDVAAWRQALALRVAEAKARDAAAAKERGRKPKLEVS